MSPATILQDSKCLKNLNSQNTLLQHWATICNTTDVKQILQAFDSSSLICTYLENKSEILCH